MIERDYKNPRIVIKQNHLWINKDMSTWHHYRENSHFLCLSDIRVGVCYRPADQEEQAVEILYKLIQAIWCSQTPAILRDFNHPHIFWRGAILHSILAKKEVHIHVKTFWGPRKTKQKAKKK